MGRPRKDVNPNIGKRIKLIRKHLKMTQLEFAEHYGVSEQAIRNWENGRNAVPGSVLEDLSERLSIDIRFLLCKTDFPNLNDVFERFDKTTDTEQLSKEIRRYEVFVEYLKLLGHDITNYQAEEISHMEKEISEFVNFKINQLR